MHNFVLLLSLCLFVLMYVWILVIQKTHNFSFYLTFIIYLYIYILFFIGLSSYKFYSLAIQLFIKTMFSATSTHLCMCMHNQGKRNESFGCLSSSSFVVIFYSKCVWLLVLAKLYHSKWSGYSSTSRGWYHEDIDCAFYFKGCS